MLKRYERYSYQSPVAILMNLDSFQLGIKSHGVNVSDSGILTLFDVKNYQAPFTQEILIRIFQVGDSFQLQLMPTQNEQTPIFVRARLARKTILGDYLGCAFKFDEEIHGIQSQIC